MPPLSSSPLETSAPIVTLERRLLYLVAVLVLIVVLLNSFSTGDSTAKIVRSPSGDGHEVDDDPLATRGRQSAAATVSSASSASSSSSSSPSSTPAENDGSDPAATAKGDVIAAPPVTLEPSAVTPVGVFDSAKLPYFVPLSVEARGRSLASLGNPSEISPDAPDDKILPPLSFAELRPLRFTVMARNIPAGLGLTTQLLTYVHLIAATQFLNRTLIFPMATRTTWFKLINMTATTFPGRAPFSYVAHRETASRAFRTRSVTKTNFKWTRELTYGAPGYVKNSLTQFGQRTQSVAVVKLPSMFKLYPFGVEEKLNFGRYLCGIVFRSPIEEAAEQILDEIKAQRKETEKDNDRTAAGDDARFVGVHLRIEPQDSVAFRRGAPTAKILREWFKREVVKVCEKHKTANVFVASGPLGNEYENAIVSSKSRPIKFSDGRIMRVFTKQQLLMRSAHPPLLNSSFFLESTTKVIWSGKHNIYPTNTRTAAVDALVLSHGVATIMTAFSSLTPFVYARQCFAGPRCYGRGSPSAAKSSNVAPGILLYELGDEGEMSRVKLYKCGYRMQELLRGGGVVDPPAKEDLFAENVRPNRMKLFED